MRGDAPADRRRPPASPVDEGSRPEERENFRADLDLDRAWRDLCRLRDDGLLEPVDLGMGGEDIGSPEQAWAMDKQLMTPRRASELTLGVLSGGAPDDTTAVRPTEDPPQR